MTTFRKITKWALQSDETLKAGDLITVTLKNGKTKQVVVGEFIHSAYGKNLYHVAETD